VLRSTVGVVVDYGEESHPGLDPTKQLNEDSCGVSEAPLGLLVVLCDGMGGHSAGEVASRTAVATVTERIASAPAEADPSEALHLALEAANAAVIGIVKGGPQVGRPGSTCVSALLSPSGLRIAHVGDSRGYLVQSGHIQRVTRDHSVVGELLAAGAITPEQAATHPNAHHITRALGMNAKVVVDVSAPQVLAAGDTILLCSDGLTDLTDDHEILAVIQAGNDAQDICKRLVALALERGGHDNVTVQCLRVLEADNVPTIVESDRSSPGRGDTPPTLMETPPLAPVTPAPTLVGNPTLVEPVPPTDRLKVAPTMVDHADRATPIALFPPAEAQRTQPKPQSLPPDLPPRRRESTLVFGSLAVVALIFVAIVLWWVARAAR
jgi:PPM family protein phosphatase